MEIHRLTQNSVREEAAWDRCVRTTHGGTVFHLSNWKKVVETVFGHRPHYLLALKENEVRGVLPLFEVRGLLSGHVLMSVPYGVYGGLCSKDPIARAALLREAQELGTRQRVRHIELRQSADPDPDLPTKSVYVQFAKPLDPEPDANFAKIPGKQRRIIRKGIKHELEARTGWEHLNEFYEVFAVNLRRLGSPPFSRRLFEAIRDHFGTESQLLTIWHKGRILSGVQYFMFQDRVMPYYAASLREGFALGVNDFMYWHLMRTACLGGYRIFDFSRSRRGSGSYDFKCHWGFEPKPLTYQYVMIGGRSVPNINPSNPRLQLFIRMWKHLPLSFTKWLGPIMTRRFPLD